MKGWYRIEFSPDFARIEGIARGAWLARLLANDPGSDPLTGEVGAHGGTAGEHVEPLGKQIEFTEPIRLRFRRVRRRGAVEALPSRWKAVGGGKGGLPAIEVGPREIRSAGHRSPFDMPRRALQIDDAPSREGWPVATRAHTTGGPAMTSRPTAASDRMIGHEGSNSDRRRLNFAARGWA